MSSIEADYKLDNISFLDFKYLINRNMNKIAFVKSLINDFFCCCINTTKGCAILDINIKAIIYWPLFFAFNFCHILVLAQFRFQENNNYYPTYINVLYQINYKSYTHTTRKGWNEQRSFEYDVLNKLKMYYWVCKLFL